MMNKVLNEKTFYENNIIQLGKLFDVLKNVINSLIAKHMADITRLETN